MTLCLHHIYVGNNIFVRGSPSARSKMEYLLLDYKTQGGSRCREQGKVEESMQDEEGERESKIINQEERPTK